jgi:radical SAM superfamily enzyme YgiQ (UPF0313 family)
MRLRETQCLSNGFSEDDEMPVSSQTAEGGAAGSNRPVWLFSLDSDRYRDAMPWTTGGLKSYFERHGETAETTNVELVHFRSFLDVGLWYERVWQNSERRSAQLALIKGLQPVAAFSCYTWNIEEFLRLARRLKQDIPEILVVAGGPQVQRAQYYLKKFPIDIIVIGEGELTFRELLDGTLYKSCWPSVALGKICGIAYADGTGQIVTTTKRERLQNLDDIPSPLKAIFSTMGGGEPYRRVSYETSRGCPYSCAFCEWGTGAIGTKMYQYSLSRIREDLEQIVRAGVEEIFFADSNFGSLHDDFGKAEVLVNLHHQHGLPKLFCTSWAKAHSPRVRDTVRLLHQAGLLEHYTLALQTLTAEALNNSNRSNLPVNEFHGIAEEMLAEGIPITTELIWGLPGDQLDSFRRSLDRITGLFPSVAIYGYTLLPGTEFYELRHKYKIETVTLREVGNWTLDYVVSTYSFTREEGQEGYFVVTAHLLLNRGNIIPLTTRYLALSEGVALSAVLQDVLLELLKEFNWHELTSPSTTGLRVYERRDRIYRAILQKADSVYQILERAMMNALDRHCATGNQLKTRLAAVMALDQALRPGSQPRTKESLHSFAFAAKSIIGSLQKMRLPEESAFEPRSSTITIYYPSHPGDMTVPNTASPDAYRAHQLVNP